MSQIVREIDFCGSIVGIMYNGNRRYKSLVGGGLTIISSMGILAVVIYYLNIFFAQKTPKMSLENIKYWEPPEHDVSHDFLFAVMMQYSGVNQFMNDKVKVDAFFVRKEPQGTTKLPVATIPCVQSDYQDDSIYKSLEFEKAICFNLTGVVLKGSNVNEIFEYLQIRFLLCIDDPDNCYPKNKMSDFFQATKPLAIIYFLDSAFQINNKNEREKAFINYIDVNITYNNAKATNIYFSKNKMKVDDNYFFSTAPKVYERYMIDTSRDLVSVRTEQQTEALTINFMSSKNEQVINITYMQLSELLANIGALVNLIILFLSSIGNYINHYYFQSDLMNALYTFDLMNKKKTNAFSFKKTANVISLHNCRDMSELNKREILTDNNNINNSNEIVNKENKPEINDKITNNNVNIKININRHTLKLKSDKITVPPLRSNTANNDKAFSQWDIPLIFFRILFPFLKCKSVTEKTIKFQLIAKSMSSFQDFINLFKKLQEIDLIKYLLLNEEQLNMYEIIPKPEWNNFANQPFSQLYHNRGFHYLKSLKEIDLSLKNKNTRTNLMNFLSKPNKSIIDEKLVTIIKSRLSKYNNDQNRD